MNLCQCGPGDAVYRYFYFRPGGHIVRQSRTILKEGLRMNICVKINFGRGSSDHTDWEIVSESSERI